ncbi:hypothetical protein SDC9_86130 [bioreactor metagenome]|uniref:Uncharacterized protein n=1 Tax=bioreactor metagenome TaxID=1076179 RepID=A0A644ZF71_9ZZZZ
MRGHNPLLIYSSIFIRCCNSESFFIRSISSVTNLLDFLLDPVVIRPYLFLHPFVPVLVT